MEIDRTFWEGTILPAIGTLVLIVVIALFWGKRSGANFLGMLCGLCLTYIVGVFVITDVIVPFYNNNQLNKRGAPATAVCEDAGCASEGGCGGTYYYYIEDKKYTGEYTGTWFYKGDTFPILYLNDKPGISYPKAGLNGSYY